MEERVRNGTICSKVKFICNSESHVSNFVIMLEIFKVTMS